MKTACADTDEIKPKHMKLKAMGILKYLDSNDTIMTLMNSFLHSLIKQQLIINIISCLFLEACQVEMLARPTPWGRDQGRVGNRAVLINEI